MKDLYAEIANGIIEQLEKGVIPWKKPWAGVRSGAISHATGRAYSLLNQLLLQRPGEYVTFNQCKQEGGSVKKGAKARTVVFWKVLIREMTDADGKVVTDDDGKPITYGLPVLRYFQVFHIDDCEGIAPKWANVPAEGPAPDERAEDVLHGYLDREGIRFDNVLSDEAYYSPISDTIHAPLREQFAEIGEYYGTVHFTGFTERKTC